MGEEAISGAGLAQASGPLSPLVTLCGKMDVLDRMLLRLRAGGHKVGSRLSACKVSYVLWALFGQGV